MMCPCVFDRCIDAQLWEEQCAHVRACGENNRAHEAKLGSVKNLSFLRFGVFLWVVMSDQVLCMWMQVTS
jgi:hypothetical protein